MSEHDQPRLPLELPERAPRRRGRKRMRTVGVSRRGRQRELVQAPVLQRCGRCGRTQTVLGDAVICAGCGSLIVRGDDVED